MRQGSTRAQRGKPYSRTYGSEIDHFNKLRISGLQAKLDWSLGAYTVTSLSSYRETRPLNRDDLDTSAIFGVDQTREEDQHQFSQELQLTSPASEKLQWIVGAYYFTEGNRVRNDYLLPFVDSLLGVPDDPQCCTLALRGGTTTDAYALFGEGTYGLTDRLEGVLGARYSSELRDGYNDFRMLYAATTAFDNIAQFDATRFNSFTPKVGLNFSMNENTFGYASISRGFKSGGFNPGSYQNDPFLPEEIWAYELGSKLTRADGRLRINSAVFFYDYTDLQVQDVENNNIVIRNAADAHTVGMEVEIAWRVRPALRIDAGLTWLDAKFAGGALVNPKAIVDGPQSLEGRRLPKAPEWKAGMGVQYNVGLPSGAALLLRAESVWQDEIFFSVFNTPQMREGSYAWTKARVSYLHTSGRWDIAAFVDNLTDEAVATNRTYTGDIVDSFITGNLAPPRTWGIEFAMRH